MQHATSNGPRASLLLCVVTLLLTFPFIADAQTLARPGWTGSGLNADPWWKHAIFYRRDTKAAASASDPGGSAGDFKSITSRLDALRSLHIDALILPAPELPPPGPNAVMPNLDGFDDLLRQASARDIRVILAIYPPQQTTDISGVARFWLNHGIAGLYVPTPPGSSPETAQAMIATLHTMTTGGSGQRVILCDADLAPSASGARPIRQAASTRKSGHAPASTAPLEIDSRAVHLPTFDAASLRPYLTQTLAQPELLLDIRPPDPAAGGSRPSLANVAATIALLTHPDALIDASANLTLQPTPEPVPSDTQQPAKPIPTPKPLPPGTYEPYVPYVPPPRPHAATAPKPLPPDPLTTWYGQLAALHHGNATLRSAPKLFFDFDAQNALVWVNKPASPTLQAPPIFVACNLSSAPVQLSLAAAVKQLNLHGWFLRPLLRSDNGMGAQNVDAVTLAPYSVYIGELRR